MSSQSSHEHRVSDGPVSDAHPVADASHSIPTAWTDEKSEQLQEAVDKIFGTGCDGLLGLEFSFTIADPLLTDCPLIGCSTGFTTLCGYEMPEIVGRNCKFLVDPVPPEMVDQAMRSRCRDFCIAAREGKTYRVPPEDRDPWLPEDRPAGELFCVQKNMRKNGELFNNMFYMKTFELGDFDEERLYIVALQSELPGGRADLAQFSRNLNQLDRNMSKVEKILAKEFIITGSMRRQDEGSDDSDEDLGKDDKDAIIKISSRVQGA